MIRDLRPLNITLETPVESLRMSHLFSRKTIAFLVSHGYTTVSSVVDLVKSNMLWNDYRRDCDVYSRNQILDFYTAWYSIEGKKCEARQILYINQSESNIALTIETISKASFDELPLASKEALVEDCISKLTVHQKILLEKKYKELCDKQPHLVYNILSKDLPTYSQAARYFYTDIDFYANAKSKKCAIIKEMIIEFESIFFDICKMKDYSETDVIFYKSEYTNDITVLLSLPFLSLEQKQWVESFKNEHNYLPMFFILKQYLNKDLSKSKREWMFSLLSGINNNGVGSSMDEAADVLNYTRERIRQLIQQKLIDNEDLLNPCLWRQYFGEVFLKEGDVIFSTIEEREKTKVNLFAYYLSRNQIEPCSLIKIPGGKTYFMSGSIADILDWKSVLSEISKLNNQLLKDDMFYDINDYLPNQSIDRNTVLPILKSIITDAYDMDLLFNYSKILVRQNREKDIDYRKALREIGEPCKVEVLVEYLNKMYPAKAPIDIQYVKNKIRSFHFVKMVGKTGLISLREWNVDTRYITEILYDIISDSDKPLSITDIRKSLPSEIRIEDNNLSATINQICKSKDVALFNNNYYGIKNRDYGTEFFITENSSRRKKFEDRFCEFKDFVITNERFPFDSGKEEEIIISRWYHNMIAGRIEATPEQIAEFNQFVDSHDGIPHDGNEFAFWTNCQNYREFVAKNKRRIGHKDSKLLYSWFNHITFNNYNNLNNRRKKWLSDLLEFINQHEK